MTCQRSPSGLPATFAAHAPNNAGWLQEGVLQTLMEHDVDGMIGAGSYERGEGRQTYRNGYRDRELKTRMGALNLRVP